MLKPRKLSLEGRILHEEQAGKSKYSRLSHSYLVLAVKKRMELWCNFTGT